MTTRRDCPPSVSSHRHEFEDRTPQLLPSFLSLAYQLGYQSIKHGHFQEWLEKEGWKELEEYRNGVRACVCACGRIELQRLNSKK